MFTPHTTLLHTIGLELDRYGWTTCIKVTEAWADVHFKDVVQTVASDFAPFYRTVVPLRDFPIGKSADTDDCKTDNVEV